MHVLKVADFQHIHGQQAAVFWCGGWSSINMAVTGEVFFLRSLHVEVQLVAYLSHHWGIWTKTLVGVGTSFMVKAGPCPTNHPVRDFDKPCYVKKIFLSGEPSGKWTVTFEILSSWWFQHVSTHLKNISQIGKIPQIGVKIKHIWNHHPVSVWSQNWGHPTKDPVRWYQKTRWDPMAIIFATLTHHHRTHNLEGWLNRQHMDISPWKCWCWKLRR